MGYGVGFLTEDLVRFYFRIVDWMVRCFYLCIFGGGRGALNSLEYIVEPQGPKKLSLKRGAALMTTSFIKSHNSEERNIVISLIKKFAQSIRIKVKRIASTINEGSRLLSSAVFMIGNDNEVYADLNRCQHNY